MIRGTTSLFALLALMGCKTIEYGPLNGDVHPRYGYDEKPKAPGEYVLKIVADFNRPEMILSMWDRRAQELCGASYEKTLFRAERPTLTYGHDGANPGSPILEGFLKCGAAAAAPESPPATSEPAMPN